MFTDDPVTPARVETLIELLSWLGRQAPRGSLQRLLQPEAIGGSAPYEQTRATIQAARELGLVAEEGDVIRLVVDGERPARQLVLEALDREVLATMDVEPYFALFYAYLLGRNSDGAQPRDGQDWANDFNRDVFRGQRQANPFNKSKHTSLGRWFRYAGLGWHDPKGTFHCNPARRLVRRLPVIFDGKHRLDGDTFFANVARACPELDGGQMFRRANPDYSEERRVCSLGLSHALIDLHYACALVLHCPLDSRGISLGLAEPPNDGKTLVSPKVDFVEWRDAPQEDRMDEAH